MRSLILACIGVAFIAAAGAAILGSVQDSAATAFSSEAVRL
jgi:hypothetical protein